ncbi:serine--tRNA ligase [Candidatus Campbellbacteria bacterium CG11_big_fil_rev_8_21_14_0_20_44_21]|uniref:Serine--tRNA ligase n=1 Tax=Candidatus Campbellbacteria bacterium CG22_combo_CG10-13_8_21_14_all_43_18 TaxID=1974530 RepID=A0A2H0DWX6_9BACT|nr:MAG: serine--tRNA ligase [Candidatus Campbellbacteria bacterium CG22_combo_CG10-13_8_21_14_all_43_18]PIR24068.1 MAG: serine--tRNA ligase [Candidatus Campbellbacteria bacterium CG11_big_fil_rev_8_21_14_0_20_44_21]
MLDIKFIRENASLVKESARKKRVSVDINRLLELDEERKSLLRLVDEKRSLQNKAGEKIALADSAEKEKMLKEMADLKSELQKEEAKLKEVLKEWQSLLLSVPNVIADDVPEGRNERENKVVRKWGEKPKLAFKVKDHVDLGLRHDLIDIETSNKVSGSRFNYLKNEAVLIQMGLMDFVFKTLGDAKIIEKLALDVGSSSGKTYTPVLPPVFVKAEVAKKMDRFDPIEDRYFFEKDDALLVGSAEHTLGPMHMDSILEEKDLPKRYIGYSTAFRREAGTYGKDTRGILRRHQFDKLEMESFSLPEEGQSEQDLIIAVQEYLLRALQIPYQVVLLCSGDMGKPDFRQIDIESWMPGEDAYRETHTSDYMTDFQARRLNTKYRKKDGETGFVHMNDATAIAVGRILIAIIENNQNEDGSINVPKILVPYVGKEIIGGK